MSNKVKIEWTPVWGTNVKSFTKIGLKRDVEDLLCDGYSLLTDRELNDLCEDILLYFNQSLTELLNDVFKNTLNVKLVVNTTLSTPFKMLNDRKIFTLDLEIPFAVLIKICRSLVKKYNSGKDSEISSITANIDDVIAEVIGKAEKSGLQVINDIATGIKYDDVVHEIVFKAIMDTMRSYYISTKELKDRLIYAINDQI